MLEWMIMPLKRYAEFSGRSRRKEFWFYSLLNLLILGVLVALRFGSGGTASIMEAARGGGVFAVYGAMFGGIGILIALWSLATFIPSLAVSIRRLHDRDMSGWWYLGFLVGSLIPLINFLVSIGFLVLMCLEGTRGPNRFGPDPKNPAAGAEVFS